MMTDRNLNIDDALELADASKRATLRKLVAGSTFIAPAVATFALDGLTSAAYAGCLTNLTSSGACPS